MEVVEIVKLLVDLGLPAVSLVGIYVLWGRYIKLEEDYLSDLKRLANANRFEDAIQHKETIIKDQNEIIQNHENTIRFLQAKITNEKIE